MGKQGPSWVLLVVADVAQVAAVNVAVIRLSRYSKGSIPPFHRSPGRGASQGVLAGGGVVMFLSRGYICLVQGTKHFLSLSYVHIISDITAAVISNIIQIVI